MLSSRRKPFVPVVGQLHRSPMFAGVSVFVDVDDKPDRAEPRIKRAVALLRLAESADELPDQAAEASVQGPRERAPKRLDRVGMPLRFEVVAGGQSIRTKHHLQTADRAWGAVNRLPRPGRVSTLCHAASFAAFAAV